MFPCFKKYLYQCLPYWLKVDAGAYNKYVEYGTGLGFSANIRFEANMKRIFKLFRPSDLKIWASKTYSLEANI
jgi:hypothetical protein